MGCKCIKSYQTERKYIAKTFKDKTNIKYQEILEDKYTNIEVLSKSAGPSITLKAKNKELNRIEIIKVIDYQYIEDTKYPINTENIERGINIMGGIDQENILKIYNTMHKTTKEGEYKFIAMEYCETGSLGHIIYEENKRGLDKRRAREYLAQIVRGVAYLHRENIFHRALGVNSIYLKEGTVKIGGFDLAIKSKIYDGDCISRNYTQIIYTENEYPTVHPPERILYTRNSMENILDEEKVDSWGIGCIYYEMLECRYPFLGEDSVVEANIRQIIYIQPQNADLLDISIFQGTLADQVNRLSVVNLEQYLNDQKLNTDLQVK